MRHDAEMPRGTPPGVRSAPAGAPAPLRILVQCLAGLFVFLVGALAAAHLHPSLLSPIEARPPARSSAPPPRHEASTTTSTTPSGATPVVQALVPATGHAGDQVTVEGSGFFSANGQVFVTFDGTVVPTRCPSEERCIATVPPPAGRSAAVVEVRTTAASSNSVEFRYG